MVALCAVLGWIVFGYVSVTALHWFYGPASIEGRKEASAALFMILGGPMVLVTALLVWLFPHDV